MVKVEICVGFRWPAGSTLEWSGRMKPACWPDVRRLGRVLEVSIGYVSVLRLQKHAKGQEVGEGRASRMSTKCSPSLSKAAFSGHRVSLPLSDTLISSVFLGKKKVWKWLCLPLERRVAFVCKHPHVPRYFFPGLQTSHH